MRKTAAVRAGPKLSHFTRILPDSPRFHFIMPGFALPGALQNIGKLRRRRNGHFTQDFFTSPARFRFIRVIARHPGFASSGFGQRPS
jgi:hypothetical protein